jgi:dUTP pyrophosphatase
MQIHSTHPGFIMPTKGTEHAGAWDIYMPEDGKADGTSEFVDLHFSTAIPEGFVAVMLPRSSSGAKYGLELNNTAGVIDSDYRGTWKAALRTKSGLPVSWKAGERLLQFIVFPVADVQLQRVERLDQTARVGGFGSTGV